MRRFMSAFVSPIEVPVAPFLDPWSKVWLRWRGSTYHNPHSEPQWPGLNTCSLDWLVDGKHSTVYEKVQIKQNIRIFWDTDWMPLRAYYEFAAHLFLKGLLNLSVTLVCKTT